MVEITNLTKKRTPRVKWKEFKEEILKKRYHLSLVLAGNALMKKLNRTHRKKDKTAKTLSFALSKTEGEIFLNINQTPKQLAFLFIHSLLHLKGLKHGKIMNKEEEKYLKKFNKDVT